MYTSINKKNYSSKENSGITNNFDEDFILGNKDKLAHLSSVILTETIIPRAPAIKDLL